MGRLTLNVLLSFAQFERKVTGERIRDKIAASKEKDFIAAETNRGKSALRAVNLLIIRENAGNFRDFKTPRLTWQQKSLAFSAAFVKIPYSTDQGNLKVSGREATDPLVKHCEQLQANGFSRCRAGTSSSLLLASSSSGYSRVMRPAHGGYFRPD